MDLRAPGVCRPVHRPRRIAALVLLGTILIQAAWAWAVPPFRGTDEIDHAFRAGEVAGGQWVTPWGKPSDGRGLLVATPGSLVEAAAPVCWSYEYTGPDNCRAVKNLGHGLVQIASGAATYNPFFYLVVGTAARGEDGAPALYVMRLVSGLLCALFIGLAAWVTATWARTLWPIFALLVGMTPVTTFSLMVVAPNGLEMAASIALWVALIGLARDGNSPGKDGSLRYLIVAAASAAVVCVVRPMGPLWVFLAVAVLMIMVGPRQALAVTRRHAATSIVGAGLVACAVAWSLIWTETVDAVRLGETPTEVANPFAAALGQLPLWLFQGVAAFPRRGNAAPPFVYVVVGLTALTFIIVGVLRSSPRLRTTIATAMVIAVLVPLALTTTTIATSGAIWQGRYGIPFHVGVLLLPGLAMDLRPPAARTSAVIWAVVGAAALVAGQAVSIVHVLVTERAMSPLSGSAEWPAPATSMIVAIMSLTLVAWSAALFLSRAPRVSALRSDSVTA